MNTCEQLLMPSLKTDQLWDHLLYSDTFPISLSVELHISTGDFVWVKVSSQNFSIRIIQLVTVTLEVQWCEKIFFQSQSTISDKWRLRWVHWEVRVLVLWSLILDLDLDPWSSGNLRRWAKSVQTQRKRRHVSNRLPVRVLRKSRSLGTGRREKWEQRSTRTRRRGWRCAGVGWGTASGRDASGCSWPGRGSAPAWGERLRGSKWEGDEN